MMYRVAWSGEDREFVATREDEPFLSWLDGDPVQALRGLIALGDGRGAR